MENKRKIFLVMAIVLMLVTITAVNAADDTQDNTISDTPTQNIEKTGVTKSVETQATTKETKNKNINKKETQTTKEAKTIILNNATFNNYLTERKGNQRSFNDEINDGDTLDIQGLIESPDLQLNIEKSVNIISTTHDGELNFYTTEGNGHNIHFRTGSSGSNITGITFNNTQLSVHSAANIVFDNITLKNIGAAIGNGIGAISIREGSDNITLANSYITSQRNGGHSCVVYAVAYNCLFENNTVYCESTVGNMFYFTTYNIDTSAYPVPNSENVTVRNNSFVGVNTPTTGICYGFMLSGNGHIIENNYLEKESHLMSIQWVDPSYTGEDQVTTSTRGIIFKGNYIKGSGASASFNGEVYNNTFDDGAVGVSRAKAYNNTFKNKVSIGESVFENNTLKELNVGDDSSVRNIHGLEKLNVTGRYNNITNIEINANSRISINADNLIKNVTIKTTSDVYVTGNGNRIQNSSIESTSTFAITLNGNNNNVSDNYIKAASIQGNTAVKTSPNNIVENNRPEASPGVQITNDTYSNYFDNEGNNIAIPDNSVISLSGRFDNKDFIFNNIHGIVSANGVTLYNSTIVLKNGTRLGFSDAFTINNENSEKTTALIIDSDNNDIPNRLTINTDGSKDDFTTVIVKGNNNTLNYYIYSYNRTGNAVKGTGLRVEGEGNDITAYWSENNSPGNFTGVILTPTSKNNIIRGTPLMFSNGIKGSEPRGVIVSGEGNILNQVTSSIYFDDGYPIILDNADNTIINNGTFSSYDNTILVNNSNNVIIENATRIQASRELYPIKLINSSNAVIQSNLIQNNQTYGGDNAVSVDENSANVTIARNTNTEVNLSDETYDYLFENNRIKRGNVINIVGDLHDKTMIFDIPITINGNGHTLYNSPITIEKATSTVNKININATEIPTAMTIKGNTTINDINITHKNQDTELKSIIVDNVTLTANRLNMNVSGPAIKESQGYDYLLPDYETDITTVAVDITGKALFLATDINVNVTSTKATIGKIAAFKNHDMEVLRSGAFSRLTRANINVVSEGDAVGIIGSYEHQSGVQNINVTGNNVYGIILNEWYNQTLYSVNLNINAKNDAIGIMRNNSEFTKNENPRINAATININANGTAIGIYARHTILVLNTEKININATNIIGLYLDDYTRNVNSHTFILNGSNVTGIKIMNSQYESTSIRNYEMTSNKINITADTGYAIEFHNVTDRAVRSNIINTTLSTESILVEDSGNINVTGNEIYGDPYEGNFAIKTVNSDDTLISGNTPQVALILTEENYDEHFENGLFKSTIYEKIQLGSDLNNKSLKFDNTLTFDGNGYTIYNSTIFKDSTALINFTNLNIVNKDVPAVISNGVVRINNSNITFTGNNKQVMIFENSSASNAAINNNIITVTGDDNTAITFNNYTLSSSAFRYNNITSTGDRNTLIQYENQTSSTNYITYNNITVNTNEAATEVVINNANLNFNNNNILVNSSHAGIPIVKVNSTRVGTVNYNNIESADLKGKNAIDTPGEKLGNTPTTDIILTDENYDEYFENSTLKIVVDTITLGSDLYNKDLIFTDTLALNGNGYTIYNGTIKTRGFDPTNITNLNIKNINKTVLEGNGSVSFTNNSVYYEGNNNNVLVFDNSTSTSSQITGNTITIIGNDNTVISSHEYRFGNNKFYRNNITMTGDRNTAINFTSSSSSSSSNYITYNNITVNTNEPVTEVIMECTLPNFNNNRIIINSSHTNAPIVQLISSNTNGQANNNYIEALDITGNAGIVSNGTRTGNTPKMNLIITDDNYDNFFEGGMLKFAVDSIELGSDLHNKDLGFTTAMAFNGNNYTIYNGTISVKGTNKYGNDVFSINHTKIYNTDDRESSITTDTMTVTINYCDIYQEGDNKQVIVLKNMETNTKPIRYNNITVKGNNTYAIYSDNYNLYGTELVAYNNFTLFGDQNVAFYYNYRNNYAVFQRNNVTVYSNGASTPIQISGSGAYIEYNTVIVNATQGRTHIIQFNGATYTSAQYNYIESFDLVGNDAVYGSSPRYNTPTDVNGYKSIINIEEKELNINTENIININVTDAFDRIINGTLTVTVNGENVEVTDNTITYTPTEEGNITITAQYNDPNGKYNTTTQSITLPVYKPQSTTNITIEAPTIGDTTNLTAGFYTPEGKPVTSGKAIFRVNGKTLRDNNGNIIYVDVVDGQAVLPDVNITGEWMKPDTTIQAIYAGNDEFEPIFTEATTINVTKREATVEITSDLTGTAGQSVTLTAKVTDNNGDVTTGRVVFKLNGKTLKDDNGKAIYVDVASGVATTTYTIPAKTKANTYKLTAVFTDSVYERAEAEADYAISKA